MLNEFFDLSCYRECWCSKYNRKNGRKLTSVDWDCIEKTYKFGGKESKSDVNASNSYMYGKTQKNYKINN